MKRKKTKLAIPGCPNLRVVTRPKQGGSYIYTIQSGQKLEGRKIQWSSIKDCYRVENLRTELKKLGCRTNEILKSEQAEKHSDSLSDHKLGTPGSTATDASQLNPKHCPKYLHCSAPLCPLDRDLEQRSYLDGEPICFYVREYVKADGPESTNIEHGIFTRIADSMVKMLTVGGADYRKKLQRASKQQSKRKILQANRTASEGPNAPFEGDPTGL